MTNPADVEQSPATRRDIRWLLANLVLPLAFLAALVFVVWNRREDLRPIFENPDGSLALIAALIVVGHSLNSAEFWLLYRAQGMHIGLFENWMVFTAGQLGNLLPGQVGTLYRFRYLKVVHSFSYTRSGSSFGANLVITFASSAIAGLVGLAGVAATGGTARFWLVAAFVALGVGSCLFVLVPMPHVKWLRGRPARIWQGFRSGWEDLRTKPAVSAGVLGLDLAKYLFVAWRFQVAFSLLGVQEPLWYFLVIAPAAGLAGALSFTPGGIGIREAFVTAAAMGMGATFDTGLLAATVDRGVMLATSVVLGSIGYGYTLRRMRRVGPVTRPA
jgi:glycosyltransferase 2 family protein